MPSHRPEFLLHEVEGDGRTTIRFTAGTVLSETNAEEFARTLRALADARTPPQLVLDLGGVVMLTSAILAKLLTLNTHVRATGGRLTLSNASADVFQVFRVARLDTVLDVHPQNNPLPV
jgi:anti-anti-sigma factor